MDPMAQSGKLPSSQRWGKNVYVQAAIFAQGITEARTRLYQMNISKHLDRISPIFEVFGLKTEHWGPFRKGINYDAFLAQRKRTSVGIGNQ
jgi:hypothetical protein